MSRQWDQAVTHHIAQFYEQETGRIQLTFLTDAEEDALLVWYREGVSPKAAANRILDARRKGVQ
jgi:hypothetical protein